MIIIAKDILKSTNFRFSKTDIRPHLYSNIVLSGGSTMFPDLKERLSKELIAVVPEGVEVKVVGASLNIIS